MSTKQRQDCYGGMVPDFEHLRYSRPTEGKAFRVFVESVGVGTQVEHSEAGAELGAGEVLN